MPDGLKSLDLKCCRLINGIISPDGTVKAIPDSVEDLQVSYFNAFPPISKLEKFKLFFRISIRGLAIFPNNLKKLEVTSPPYIYYDYIVNGRVKSSLKRLPDKGIFVKKEIIYE